MKNYWSSNESQQHEENHLKSIKESEGEMSEPSLIELTDDKEFMERVLKKSEEMQETVRKRAWIEQAKEEAKQNLRGEDLKKCFAALEAWYRNSTH